ncbi:MAG: protein kinase [Vicinamibacterales bacterium]
MVGRTLRHYRIVRALGSGGMGEVYAAEDTRLSRQVALKLLPPDAAADADRLARFQREARALAGLNHPNVVTIHSVEEADGVHFLTMEIVEGKTLAGLIPSTGVAWPDFFKWALQLVDAIVAAHQRGVVHRDLKPANIMIGSGGRLKVLDFGLAKLKRAVPEHSDLLATATDTVPHLVLGTAAYMSPEHAEGRPVDSRSDIFSLGIVLYEMATGTRPFKGDSALSLLSSIIKDPVPPVSGSRPDAPAGLERILRRCLAKDPERRYQTAVDVRNDLEELQQEATAPSGPVTAAAGAVPQRTGWSRAGMAGLALGAAALGVAAWAWLGPSSTPAPAPVRATFSQLTHLPGIEWFPTLSPDGRWVVYAGDAAGNRDIYLQSVTGQTPINLTANSPEDDDQPAFSPDGEQIVFRSARDGGGLFVMGRTGEAVRRISRAGFNPAWSRDGTAIAYTTTRTELKPQNTEGVSELWVVDLDGGEPRRLSDLDCSLPSWSPGGGRIAFGIRSTGLSGSAQGEGTAAERRLDILTIPVDGGQTTAVTEDAYVDWNPVWAPDGRHLYFISDRGGSTNIWRVPIDESSGRPLGPPEPVTSPAPFAAHLTISADGTRLAYSSFLETQNIEKLELDPSTGRVVGQPTAVTTGSRYWANPDPSPDGRFVVVYSQVNPEGDLYIVNTDGSGALRQLTSDPAVDRVPRWSPDGNWITAFSDRDGSLHVWRIRPDGSDLQQMTMGNGASIVAWSPDAARMAVALQRAQVAPHDVHGMVIMDANRPLSQQAADRIVPGPPTDGRFVPNSWSPDGRWITGQGWFGVLGVFVYSVGARSFERYTDYGEWPVWLPDSRHILFVSRGREFRVLDTRTRATRQVFSVLRDTLGPPRLTSDGRHAFFSRRTTESDIWLISLQ